MPQTGDVDRFLVVLDYDGPLCDTRGAIVDAIKRVFKMHRIALPDDAQIADAVGTGAALPQVLRLLHSSCRTLTNEQLIGWTDDYRRLYAEHSAAGVTAYPGVAETLHRLAEDVDIVVMSNKGAAAVNASLDALGLSRSIIAVIADEPNQVRKPDARVFTDRIIPAISPPYQSPPQPERTIMVGDTAADLLFAKNSRLRAQYGYGCPDRCANVGYDFRITCFKDITKVIAKLR